MQILSLPALVEEGSENESDTLVKSELLRQLETQKNILNSLKMLAQMEFLFIMKEIFTF